jgi:hypothetical protein
MITTLWKHTCPTVVGGGGIAGKMTSLITEVLANEHIYLKEGHLA